MLLLSSKRKLSKKFRNGIRVSNSFDPDQNRCSRSKLFAKATSRGKKMLQSRKASQYFFVLKMPSAFYACCIYSSSLRAKFFPFLSNLPVDLVCRGPGKTTPLSHLTNYNFLLIYKRAHGSWITHLSSCHKERMLTTKYNLPHFSNT